MTLYIIGENNESNKVIVDFSEEYNIEYKFSNEISSAKSFVGAINEALQNDVIVIDVMDLMIENDEFDNGIKTLKGFNGTVIVYAPSASYNDAKINICNHYGFDNIVRDVLAARAKARFKSFIPNLEAPTPPQMRQYNNNDNGYSDSQNVSQRRPEAARRPVNQATPNDYYEPQSQPQRPQRHPMNSQPQREDYQDNYDQSYGRNSTPVREPRRNNDNYDRDDYYYSENTNSDSIYREEQPADIINSANDIVVTKRIGVIGVLHRIGTTTQAIMVANTLKSLGKSACYVQFNDSSFINNMENYFTDVEKSPNKGCLTYEGLDFYENKNLVLSQSYDYHIRDYGACGEDHQIPTDFFNNDIRIIVCGGTAEEVSSLTELRSQLYADNGLIYVFSFIADYEKNDIQDLMGDKTNTVLFAPYTPDCYRLTDEAKQVYLSAFGIETEPTKKKKGFGFKRKKG